MVEHGQNTFIQVYQEMRLDKKWSWDYEKPAGHAEECEFYTICYGEDCRRGSKIMTFRLETRHLYAGKCKVFHNW